MSGERDTGVSEWDSGRVAVDQKNGSTWLATIRELAWRAGSHAMLKAQYDPGRTAGEIALIVLDGIVEAFEDTGVRVLAPADENDQPLCLSCDAESLRAANERLRADRDAVVDILNLHGSTLLHQALTDAGLFLPVELESDEACVRHCWHTTYLLPGRIPPQVVKRCCWCDVGKVELRRRSDRAHGPYIPDADPPPSWTDTANGT